jgi:hypothetical protein
MVKQIRRNKSGKRQNFGYEGNRGRERNDADLRNAKFKVFTGNPIGNAQETVGYDRLEF